MKQKINNCLYCEKKLEENITTRKRFCSSKCRVYYNRQKTDGLKIKKAGDNKPANKKEIKQPLTDNRIVRHPLWEEGDPAQGTMAFMFKYDCVNYEELKPKE